MRQARCQPHLLEKTFFPMPGRDVRPQHLQNHWAIVLPFLCAEDYGHASVAQSFESVVAILQGLGDASVDGRQQRFQVDGVASRRGPPRIDRPI